VLADFCLESLEDGCPPQFVVECVAAASKRYLNRRIFRAAAKLVNGWKSTLPSNEAHPVPEDAAYSMVVLSVLIGQFDLAFVILVCFCGLLRIGECLALQPVHITLGKYATGAEYFIILLVKTKAGLTFPERVVICHPKAVTMLKQLLVALRRPSYDFVVRLSYVSVNRMLAVYSQFLGYEVVFRSHSLRRGGATALLIQGLPFADIQLFGRWASDRSCRLYLRKGEALLLQTRCRQQDRVRRLLSMFDLCFSPCR
jgi:integrase